VGHRSGVAGAVRQTAGTDVVFQMIAVLLLVGAVVTALFIHDVAARRGRRPDRWRRRRRRGGVARPCDARARRRPPVRRALVATMAWMGAVGILAGFLPETAEALGAPASAVGGLFTAYAVMAGLLMLSPLSGRVDRATARTG
jgi:hypothetical protein